MFSIHMSLYGFLADENWSEPQEVNVLLERRAEEVEIRKLNGPVGPCLRLYKH